MCPLVGEVSNIVDMYCIISLQSCSLYRDNDLDRVVRFMTISSEIKWREVHLKRTSTTYIDVGDG